MIKLSRSRAGDNETGILEAEKFISQLEPGFLPMPIFSQIVRLVVTPTVEMVPFRRIQEKGLQVLLIKRDDDDPHWPGQYHVPGSVIRATDAKLSFQDAFNRIIKGEIKGIKVIKGPIFVQHLFHQVKRGAELPMIHWIEVSGEVSGGTYFDVDKLPENIVDHHPLIIRKALEHFSAHV